MRVWLAAIACLALGQCASAGQPASARTDGRSYVIIGVAESARSAEPKFSMLWRPVDSAAGAFLPWDSARGFEARTNVRGSVRAHGVPGEFTIIEVAPGDYALDSVFAEIEENRLRYFANGVLQGPERPGFSIAPGEAIYLGIWQTQLDATNASASAHLWRQEADDLREALGAARGAVHGALIREPSTVTVVCNPQPMGSSPRLIC